MLSNQPTLGALDIGDDFVMRDASQIGGDNSRIRFRVLPESSGLAFLASDEEEADVEFVRERDNGSGGTSSSPAKVKSGGSVYEVPDAPEEIIVVEAGGGGGGGVSEDPFLKISGGDLRIAQAGQTSNGALLFGESGRMGLAQTSPGELSMLGGNLSVTEGSISAPNGQVWGDILFGNFVVGNSMQTGGLEVFGDVYASGDLNADTASFTNLEIPELSEITMLGYGGAPSYFGLDQAGAFELSGPSGLSLTNMAAGLSVNMHLTTNSALGAGDNLGTDTVLQVGSSVKTGGLLVDSNGGDFQLGADNDAGGWGDFVELDEEIYEAVGYSFGQSGSDHSSGWGTRGVSPFGGGLQAHTLGARPTLEVATEIGIEETDVVRVTIGDPASASGDVFNITGFGSTVINSTTTDPFSLSSSTSALRVTQNRPEGRSEGVRATTTSSGTVPADSGWFPIGVYGRADSATSTSAVTIGVRGWTNSSGGYGVYSAGDLGGNGGKFFHQPHPTDPSKEIRFACLEGNESGTYFRGSAHVEDGRAVIEIPEDFRLASEEEGITVQLTPVGALAILAIESRSAEEIVVLGSEDVEFDYMVNGVRRGFAGLETILDNHSFLPEPSEWDKPAFTQFRPAYRQLLVDNGVLNADFTPNLETAERLGWIQNRNEDLARADLTPMERLLPKLVERGLATPDGKITPAGRELLGAKGD
jgi:hypothetical protein